MNRILIPALTSALVLAACGASSAPAATAQATRAASAPSAATSAAPAASAVPAAAAPAGPARKVTLGATNDRYSIATLDVKPGEKIEFVMTNTGDEKHNLVGLGESVSLVSPDFDAGQTVSWAWTAPDKPMTFRFQCSFHKNVPPITVTVK